MRHLIALLGEDLISIFSQVLDLFTQVVVETQLYEGFFRALLFFKYWNERVLDAAGVVVGFLVGLIILGYFGFIFEELVRERDGFITIVYLLVEIHQLLFIGIIIQI